MTIKYSVLDQSIAVAGEPQGQAIRNTVELAGFCERLGDEDHGQLPVAF